MELKQLKSGTDLRGAASDFTDAIVRSAATGFVSYLRRTADRRLRIAVGRDSRLSGERIEKVLVRELKRLGCEVYVCGMCSTPSMFMMTKFPDTDCDGSVMITASHHPKDKNGLKFFTKEGGVNGAQLNEIISLAGSAAAQSKGAVVKGDFLGLYCSFLQKKITDALHAKKPLSGLKIAVDAGNGAAGFFAERVLKPLGADISASQYLAPDGRFPHHAPNPENADAMRSLSARVKRTKAHLGIIFDTDGDRAAFVAADGLEINRNRLVALVSAIMLTETPGATVVTDSVTSEGLTAFIESRGGVHHRFKRGYRNVIDEAVRLESTGVSAPVAIETSGHAALKENYFLDDGAYLAVRILIQLATLKKLGLDLQSLISDLAEPVETAEVRLKFNCEDWQTFGAFVLDNLASACARLQGDAVQPAAVNHEGVRVRLTAADGWFLARMSVHDPLIVVNMESNKTGGVKELAAFLYAYFKAYSELDVLPLAVL